GAVKKFLGLISFYPFGNLPQFLGNLALSSQILELFNSRIILRFAGCLIEFLGRLVVILFGSNCFDLVCLRSQFVSWNSALEISLSKLHFYVLKSQFLWWFGCSGFQKLSRFSIWVVIKFNGLRALIFPQGGFLNPISTNCVKRLTKHLRVTHNAWRSQFKLGFCV
ncbi:hypothetical protein, partial [Vibrio vulnificus]|uniref:hypothetical protein n=1 Tax=Vibrio vulnificus TaxID=672 RepID=UPI00307CEE80